MSATRRIRIASRRLSAFRPAAVALLFALSGFRLEAEVFRFQYSEGDSYRINSLVQEKVYVNRAISHAAEITNRITVRVSDVREDEGMVSAFHDCVFQTSERTTNKSFSWGREYQSGFRRDELGIYDIDDSHFMPVVRNVPTFPDGDVQPGETWKGTGEEAHDLRDRFGIETPFRAPFAVTYTYVGPTELEGKKLHLIRAEYSIFFDTPAELRGKERTDGDYPVLTMGYSRQQLYWDNEQGYLPYYNEDFSIQLKLASGTVYEFRGTAEATVTEIKAMNRKQIVQEMNDEISKMGLSNVSAEDTPEGIMLSIENIQFEADSARLMAQEKEKILRIAALLERYPDKELLISGHTALAGTAAARQKLSEERADAVARFLVENGVRSEYNVYTRGFGAEKPLVPNTSEDNRARNRRVEITILEK